MRQPDDRLVGHRGHEGACHDVPDQRTQRSLVSGRGTGWQHRALEKKRLDALAGALGAAGSLRRWYCQWQCKRLRGRLQRWSCGRLRRRLCRWLCRALRPC